MFLEQKSQIKSLILNLEGFKKQEITAVKTPRHYTIFFKNVEILNLKYCWIDKSDNYFEIESGNFLAENLGEEIAELQNIIKDILNCEWLEFSDNIEIED